MKVGVVVGGYGPDTGGGYTFETEIVRSLLALAGDSAHEFVMFCPPEYAGSEMVGRKSPRLEIIIYRHPGILQKAVEMLQRRSAFFRSKWHHPSRIERLLRAAGIEFAWFTSPGADCVDTPYLTIVWDLMHRTEPWFPEVSGRGEWDTRELAYSWFLRRATAIITGTQAGREQLATLYQIPGDRVHIAPHPTPSFALHGERPVSDPVILEKHGIGGEYVLYPAQFWPHKNHVNLLMGIKALRDEVGSAPQVVFVGSDKGNREHVMRCVRELELTDQVCFLGFIPTPDLVALYRQALALLYTSFGGPENLPPLEAFALGCPVIAADIPGASEQLGDAALLVAPDKPDAIAAAVRQLRDDVALRRSLIEKGAARARRWTGHDFVTKIFSILDNIEPIRRAWGPGDR